MHNLFLSFFMAIFLSAGVVGLLRLLRLEFYPTNIFPLVPVFYALVYEILERKRLERSKPKKNDKPVNKPRITRLFENITVSRILSAIALSFVIKLVFELIFLILYIQSANAGFYDIYGTLNIDTISRFVRGDHPWLAGSSGFYNLCLLALITSLGTGLWIGYTSRGRAVVEGVFVGAAFTLVTAVTNMLVLYREIEALADQMVETMGSGTRIGLAIVLAVQVLLFGFWSGIAQTAKLKRRQIAAAKKSPRKSPKSGRVSVKKNPLKRAGKTTE